MATDNIESEQRDDSENRSVAAVHGRHGGRDTSANLVLPAGGIRRPHAADIWGGVREHLFVRRHGTAKIIKNEKH